MSVLEHVAGNLRRLRQSTGLSQQALADAAGVSRRMLVGIESGDANVSLNTLDRLAEALDVKFADLVQPAGGGGLERIKALAWSGRDTASQGVLLASVQAGNEMELWSWTLMPGERYAAPADPPGWKEVFFVIEGTLVLELAEGDQRVPAGDFLVFDSTRDYAYRNDGDAPLRFIRNVVY